MIRWVFTHLCFFFHLKVRIIVLDLAEQPCRMTCWNALNRSRGVVGIVSFIFFYSVIILLYSEWMFLYPVPTFYLFLHGCIHGQNDYIHQAHTVVKRHTDWKFLPKYSINIAGDGPEKVRCSTSNPSLISFSLLLLNIVW